MQDKFSWIPPHGPLGRLTDAAHARASVLATRMAEFRDQVRDAPDAVPFAAALRRGDRVAVIAELKRQSPSKGVINADIEATERASQYVAGGARALSILTEPREFGGRNEDLLEVHRRVQVPLLKKDFHVHAVQLWEARALGASAALLIARALPPAELMRLVDEAFAAGLEPLVEVRSEEELDVALRTPAQVIGVNARDLETLVIEPEVSARLLPAIPAERVRVAESGMSSADDVECAARQGAHAVLIGSILSADPNPEALLRQLCAVQRRAHDS
ncbi:MAG: indole-3-glycerol phosphate synthase TrpC [Gemmatimonadaceae bacterium]